MLYIPATCRPSHGAPAPQNCSEAKLDQIFTAVKTVSAHHFRLPATTLRAPIASCHPPLRVCCGAFPSEILSLKIYCNTPFATPGGNSACSSRELAIAWCTTAAGPPSAPSSTTSLAAYGAARCSCCFSLSLDDLHAHRPCASTSVRNIFAFVPSSTTSLAAYGAAKCSCCCFQLVLGQPACEVADHINQGIFLSGNTDVTCALPGAHDLAAPGVARPHVLPALVARLGGTANAQCFG